MSTRSLICKQIDKNLYEAIYCHSDGYLTYNGAMLIDHYKDEEIRVAEAFLNVSGHHSRKHHAQGHECSAERIMCRLVFSFREVDQI